MDNYIESGDIAEHIATEVITKGKVYFVDTVPFVAMQSAKIGELWRGMNHGVFSLEKEEGEVMTMGKKLYWMAEDGHVTFHNTGMFLGYCWRDSPAEDPNVHVNFFNQGLYPNRDVITVVDPEDFPEPDENGVINLLDGYTYQIVGDVDITPYRINCLGVVTIIGYSSETSYLRSDLAEGVSLITTNFSLPLRHITLDAGVGDCLDIDGLGSAEAAYDWFGVNFLDTNVGTIKNVGNTVIQSSAVINSDGFTFDGTHGSIVFVNSIFRNSVAGQKFFTGPSTLNVSRRIRISECAFVALAGATAFDIDVNATIPTDSYIIKDSNFSGGGTYIAGVQHDDNKARFEGNKGIENTTYVTEARLTAQATVTVLAINTFYNMGGGTIVAGDFAEKFTIDSATGELTYTGGIQQAFKFTLQATLSTGNNNVLRIKAIKTISAVESATSHETQEETSGLGRLDNVRFSCIARLNTGDKIRPVFANATQANNITISAYYAVIEPVNA